jgi:tetratricopeptide (TPR) repeat protein
MFRRKWILRIFSLGSAFWLAAGLLMAQGFQANGSTVPGNLSYQFVMNHMNFSASRYHVVAGRVMTTGQDIVRGAEVHVSPLMDGDSRVFKTNANGEFQTLYNANDVFHSDFKVWLTIRKHGYQTAHELIDYADFQKPVWLPLTLRPKESDPTLLSQQDLLSDLLPRLRSLGPADGLSAKSEKKYARGVQKFIEKGRPDRSLSDFTDVAKLNPECAKCLTMLALADLDSGNWDGAARRADAAIKLTTSKNSTSGSLEAVVLGGVMRSWMHAPQVAAQFFAYANGREPGNKLVLQELGRAYLQLHEYGLADACLKSSVAAGGGQDAYVLWIQALLGEDNVDEANAEMNRYLHGRAIKKMPLEVRKVWAVVQNRKEVEALYAKTHNGRRRKHERRAAASIDVLHDSPQQLHLKGLEPAKSQDDLKEILAAAGKNVATLYHDLQNSTSLEKVRQQKLHHNGKVAGEAVEKFHYLCLMPDDPHVPGFKEYRKSAQPGARAGSVPKTGYMLTSGFVSSALVFYPDYQSGSEFRYLGRQRMDGHETYVVAFAQIPMKAPLVGNFTVGKHSAPTFQQGLAWIDTQNYQIVCLRTDLLKPLPEVRLSKETTRIDYQEVHFKQLARSLWLPKDVTVTVDWHGKTLRNDHQYSDFKLFNVGAAEKIAKRTRPKTIADSQTAHQ